MLHVTSSYPRSADDASAPFLADLAVVQADAGMDVHVLCPHDRGLARHGVQGAAMMHRFRYAPERFERLAYRGGLLAMARRPAGALLVVPYLLATFAATFTTMRRLRPDVVHAHWWFPSGLAAVLAGMVLRIPVVVSVLGTDLTLATMPVLGPLGRWVLGRAAVAAATSRSAAAQVQAVFGRDAVVLGVPVTVAAEPDVYVPPPAGTPLQLVAAGRFVQEKGFDVLLDAVAICRDRGADVRLKLIGAGPLEAELRARAGDGVHIQPFGERRVLHEAVLAADALVMPSRREGYGMMAAEAAMLGRCVVASAVGGLREIVEPGRNGLLVPAEDPNALADAILTLPLEVAIVPDETRTVAAVRDAHLDAYHRASRC